MGAEGLVETGISGSNGVWFGNFDASFFPLNEPDWEITGGPSGRTVNLKRTSTMVLYELNPNATVFFRGTPDLLPIPRVLMASEVVSELFDDVESFECCDSSDCELKFPNEDRLGLNVHCIAK